jgi:hypothetical protein
MTSPSLTAVLANLTLSEAQEVLETADQAVSTDITVLFDELEEEDVDLCTTMQTNAVEGSDSADEDADVGDAIEKGASASPAVLQRTSFIQWQERDAFCDLVKRYLQGKELPDDRKEALMMLLNRDREWFQVDDDGLVTHLAVDTVKRGKVLRQWVTPLALRPLLLYLAHDYEAAQHPTVTGTHARLL